MSLEEEIKLFSMVDVLEPLSPEELADLARRTPVVEFDRNHVIYTPDYRGNMLFILLEGRVRIYKSVDGHEFTFDLLDSGTMFGSTAFAVQFQYVYERPWAETTEPSSIALIRRESFERLVMSNPEVGLKAMQLFSKRLYAMSSRMADIALKDVLARLASMILYMIEGEGVKDSEGFIIPTRHTHRHLGTMIGADRVAVTRAFTKLQETGAVKLTERQIHIKDLEALKKIAEGKR